MSRNPNRLRYTSVFFEGVTVGAGAVALISIGLACVTWLYQTPDISKRLGNSAIGAAAVAGLAFVLSKKTSFEPFPKKESLNFYLGIAAGALLGIAGINSFYRVFYYNPYSKLHAI